eukprot:5058698-Pleurochrysis_carterae.AAC.1
MTSVQCHDVGIISEARDEGRLTVRGARRLSTFLKSGRAFRRCCSTSTKIQFPRRSSRSSRPILRTLALRRSRSRPSPAPALPCADGWARRPRHALLHAYANA